MKIKIVLMLLLVVPAQMVAACSLCEKQQPKPLRGITHGTGPESNWDWLMIGLVTAGTLWTFIFSLKYLIKPGEKNSNHIKQSILTY